MVLLINRHLEGQLGRSEDYMQEPVQRNLNQLGINDPHTMNSTCDKLY